MDNLEELITHAAGHGADPAVMEVVRELAARLKAAEAALDRVFPGWRMDNACLPNCQGACCEV